MFFCKKYAMFSVLEYFKKLKQMNIWWHKFGVEWQLHVFTLLLGDFMSFLRFLLWLKLNKHLTGMTVVCVKMLIKCHFQGSLPFSRPVLHELSFLKDLLVVLPVSQTTPASSLCVQSVTPQPLKLQSDNELSEPLQFTSSSQIGPDPKKQ